MEIKMHGALKLVPWESWNVWDQVREAVFSPSPSRVMAALNKIAAWRAKNSLPVAVEVTRDLISIQRTDPFFLGSFSKESSITDEMLCLMYAMAIMRLINGVVDHSKRQNTSSVADRAEAAGLPRMLVDIRHEVAHQELPSLSYLRLASKQALGWLKEHYWDAQKQVLDNTHQHLDAKLQAYASSSENKVLNLVGRKALTRLAKKLVTLSCPVFDLFRNSNDTIDMVTTDLAMDSPPPDKFEEIACSDDIMDLEFEKSERALLKARKRLQTFYKSNHNILHSKTEPASGIPCEVDEFNPAKVSRRFQEGCLADEQWSKKGAWSLTEDWRPCAIGMLPSKSHAAGVLPPFGNPFAGLEKLDTTCETRVQEKLSNEVVVVDVPQFGTDVEGVASINSLEEANAGVDLVSRDARNDTEREIEVCMAKRLKANNGSCLNPATQDGPCELGFTKDVRKGLPPGKHRAFLSRGFVLLDGLYQMCGAEELAAIQSSIHVL